jgi:hypothetical protein
MRRITLLAVLVAIVALVPIAGSAGGGHHKPGGDDITIVIKTGDTDLGQGFDAEFKSHSKFRYPAHLPGTTSGGPPPWGDVPEFSVVEDILNVGGRTVRVFPDSGMQPFGEFHILYTEFASEYYEFCGYVGVDTKPRGVFRRGQGFEDIYPKIILDANEVCPEGNLAVLIEPVTGLQYKTRAGLAEAGAAVTDKASFGLGYSATAGDIFPGVARARVEVYRLVLSVPYQAAGEPAPEPEPAAEPRREPLPEKAEPPEEKAKDRRHGCVDTSTDEFELIHRLREGKLCEPQVGAR